MQCSAVIRGCLVLDTLVCDTAVWSKCHTVQSKCGLSVVHLRDHTATPSLAVWLWSGPVWSCPGLCTYCRILIVLLMSGLVLFRSRLCTSESQCTSKGWSLGSFWDKYPIGPKKGLVCDLQWFIMIAHVHMKIYSSCHIWNYKWLIVTWMYVVWCTAVHLNRVSYAHNIISVTIV